MVIFSVLGFEPSGIKVRVVYMERVHAKWRQDLPGPGDAENNLPEQDHQHLLSGAHQAAETSCWVRD